MANSFVRKVALLSVVMAAIHFAGETAWHFKFGQPLSMLVVDYIAVGLLVFGGLKTLGNEKAVGLLCGAWSFEFCLNYRSLFSRVEKLMAGQGFGDPSIDSTAYVPGFLLLVSITMFSITLKLCTPKNGID